MFQGIIPGLAEVKYVENKGDFMRIGIFSDYVKGKKEGSSIAINGTCLTVTREGNGVVYFDVIQETLEKTNLGLLQEGDNVNIESPLTLGEPISGHLIQGHVEGIGQIIERKDEGENCRMSFLAPEHLLENMLSKGSIAVDGISLTIVDTDKERNVFSVALIPETLNRTTLGFKKERDKVNIETDSLVKALMNSGLSRVLDNMNELENKIDSIESRVKKLEGSNNG